MSEIDLKRFFLEQVRLFESFPGRQGRGNRHQVPGHLRGQRSHPRNRRRGPLHRRDDQRPRRNLGHRQHRHPRCRYASSVPGDVFGVMSLLTGDRIVADVIAGNRCFVLMIPQEVFNTHILTNPKAVGYLSRLLADRTRAMSSDAGQQRRFARRRSLRPVAEHQRAGQGRRPQRRHQPDSFRHLRHRGKRRRRAWHRRQCRQAGRPASPSWSAPSRRPSSMRRSSSPNCSR
jgi:hypothetical protein